MLEADSAGGPPITAWWGKLGSGRDHHGYHPLICHMLDVAAVAEAMWDHVLSPAARRAITAGLGLTDESAARIWVAFLAGLHDTGKCSPAFALRPGAERLAHLYASCSPNPGRGDPRAAPHGVVTALALTELLERRFGVPRRAARTLATAVGGHHGSFPSALRLQELQDKPDAVGEGGWETAREALVEGLAELLQVDRLSVPNQVDHATALTLAGLVSVADWIGSMEEFFPYEVKDLADIPAAGMQYLQRTRGQARHALRELHWTGWTPGTAYPSFSEMFEGKEPRPLQEAAIALSERLSGPGLVVIEAPMGEGKTEAALYLADRWGLEQGARGLYLALPTQATSNQMFGRLTRFLEHRYPADVVNLQLLHGHADLLADFAELKQRDALVPQLSPDDESEGDTQAGVIAGRWFAQRKRGLLAPFGVGTVDQALLAVLRTKHVFVRLYGLANRVVVIDEVHAYDTYMTTLIERLLEWLAALGSPVILLSATLPRARRDVLLHAYAHGLAGHEAAGPEPHDAHYPRMTWVLRQADGGVERGAVQLGSSQPERALRLRWEDGRIPDDPDAGFPLGEKLREALRNGGCAAVICNTVRRAQRMYRALEPYFEGEASEGLPMLDLFHARFQQRDRAEREARTVARFGPGAKQRPDRAVLVATQVIEQSLDLDFDVMVTDFAPVDLLLQRAGRLWRHDRTRPSGLDGPVLWICAPERDDEGLPAFPGGDALIYEEHVLFRSWLATAGRERVTIPDDIEPLVEAVYGGEALIDGLSDAERTRWQSTLDTLREKREHDHEEANKRWLPRPEHDVPLSKFTEGARAEDEPGFHPEHQALTRLTEPSVQVIFLHGDPGRPSLDRGGRSLNVSARPSSELTRALLERSVTLPSPRGLVSHLLEKGFTPNGWQRSPHLRNARLIVLDADGRAEHGGYRIQLDDKLGVVAEKWSAPEREQA